MYQSGNRSAYAWGLPKKMQAAVLHITTFSTFVSENSALGAKLIMAARSQG